MFKSKDLHRQALPAIGRRQFLRLGAAAAATLLASPVLASVTASRERKLDFQNTHTGESTSTVYWSEDRYVESGLQEINSVLRDHRSDEIYPIDTDLLDLLFVLQSQVGCQNAYQIISGYRSPATNSALRNKSSGVAKHSYHMQGKAIDIRLPGCELSTLRTAALEMKAGGVGYYPASDFIHVDVGPARRW